MKPVVNAAVTAALLAARDADVDGAAEGTVAAVALTLGRRKLMGRRWLFCGTVNFLRAIPLQGLKDDSNLRLNAKPLTTHELALVRQEAVPHSFSYRCLRISTCQASDMHVRPNGVC